VGLRFRFLGLLAAVLGTIACGAIVTLDPWSREPAASALLEPSSATVSVRFSDGAFIVVTDVAVLRAGDGVRTDANGRAVITYADGRALLVGPDADLTIAEITFEPSFFLAIKQNAGRVWYALARTFSASSFLDRTGALAAVVRAGSAIEIIVEPDGATQIVAVEGTAGASAGGSTVSGTSSTSIAAPPKASAPVAPATSSASSSTSSPSTSPVATAAPGPTPMSLVAYVASVNVKDGKLPSAVPTLRPRPRK